MAAAKKRSEQHLIDQQGAQLLRAKLPQHWVLREYRPNYGLDFTIELFITGEKEEGRHSTYETLGEHVFEPPRVCRRLQLLRRRSHGKRDNEQVLA